jgi:RND family efflux transporter MFP subunit
MVQNRAIRAGAAGLVLGGCVLAVASLAASNDTTETGRSTTAIASAAILTKTVQPLELTAAEVTDVVPAPLTERLRVSGALQPVERVTLRAKSSGKVVEVSAREGQRVKVGEVLVRFETDDLKSVLHQRESELMAANAELDLAKQALARIEQLAVKNVSSRDQLEKARRDLITNDAKLQGLSAQVETARLALREAEVVAPLDGVVASRSIDTGSRVSEDGELMVVVDTSVMEAKVLVSTRDITRVRTGQVAKLRIDGLDGQTIEAIVDRLGPIAEEGSRFIPVYLRLKNHEGHLWGGMFADGELLLRESSDALTVPAISLRKDDAGHYVLKYQNGRLSRQAVKPGTTWKAGSLVEITHGLAIGDTIVTAPLPALQPDMAVTLTKAG